MDHVANDLSPILVTGANGYLGSHVLSKLREKGQPTVALTRQDCDLTDEIAVRTVLDRIKPRVLIHCAAEVPKSSAAYGDSHAAESSVAMVRALSNSALCPIVFASSMTVYSGSTRFPVGEEDAVPPSAGYAFGKWRAEQILAARNVLGDVALRLPGLFGLPRRSGLLYNAAKSFATHGKFEPTGVPDIWAAMAVQDAAQYLVLAATTSRTLNEPVQTVNVGWEGQFSVPSAVAEIAMLCGVEYVPGPVSAKPFSMRLERLKGRYGLMSVTFRQRLAELVKVVQDESSFGK